jgi:hypothetical protein
MGMFGQPGVLGLWMVDGYEQFIVPDRLRAGSFRRMPARYVTPTFYGLADVAYSPWRCGRLYWTACSDGG